MILPLIPCVEIARPPVAFSKASSESSPSSFLPAAVPGDVGCAFGSGLILSFTILLPFMTVYQRASGCYTKLFFILEALLLTFVYPPVAFSKASSDSSPSFLPAWVRLSGAL